MCNEQLLKSKEWLVNVKIDYRAKVIGGGQGSGKLNFSA